MKKPNVAIQRAYAARKRSIQRLYAKNWTLQRIAERWGITKQRVSQILKDEE
jgi:DNA-directed RNA polymerase specialized sigma subunit